MPSNLSKRRAVLAALAGTALASAARVHPQPRSLRVAWMTFSSTGDGQAFFDGLRQGFRDLGYVEGDSLILESYWANESEERLAQAIVDAAARSPQVVVAQGIAVTALHRAQLAIPVVFGFSGDPVEAGFCRSLASPGGNMTGISFLTIELVGKRMEMLKAVLPRLKRVAVIAAPQHPGDAAERRASEAAASALGISTAYFEARNATELEAALGATEKSGCDAVVIFPVQYVISQRAKIADWSMRTRVPTVSGWAQFADGGNLMSYGPDLRDCVRRLAYFADRIGKGTRAADIPVELPTRVEFVLNQKAAKALGISVPQSVVLRADRVIT